MYSVITLILLWGIYIIGRKITQLEIQAKDIFAQRNDSVILLYECSKEVITKHQEIFETALAIRKQIFVSQENIDNFEAFLHLQAQFHHEIEFIFQICQKHPQLLKDKYFLFTQDLIENQSKQISNILKLRSRFCEIHNKIARIARTIGMGFFWISYR